jgi:hypothetical protein
VVEEEYYYDGRHYEKSKVFPGKKIKNFFRASSAIVGKGTTLWGCPS